MQGELFVEAGRDQGRLFVIRLSQTLTIGRGDQAEIRLRDDLISRAHATVELRTDGLHVTDLDSRNGTYVGGRRLKSHVTTLLPPNERLEVGEHALRADVPGLDAPPAGQDALLTGPLADLPRDEFEVLAEIGRGAVGTVYAARQRLSDRPVAIKVLHDEPLDGRNSQAERIRLLREAKICGRLDSPYVVRVFDVRIISDRLFLIMELVDGPTLADRLQHGPIRLRQALQLGEDVALGLKAAHAIGVIHRDIKPGNILIGPDGVAKVADFGIAKDLFASRILTASNLGLGSMAYVSPEQASGARDVDHRADVYSLGATLYHALAGRPPLLPNKAPMKAIIELVERPPDPLSRVNPEVPPDVARLIHAMLEKDPDARPATAAAVAQELRRLRERFAPPSSDELEAPRGEVSTREAAGLSSLDAQDELSA